MLQILLKFNGVGAPEPWEYFSRLRTIQRLTAMILTVSVERAGELDERQQEGHGECALVHDVCKHRHSQQIDDTAEKGHMNDKQHKCRESVFNTIYHD